MFTLELLMIDSLSYMNEFVIGRIVIVGDGTRKTIGHIPLGIALSPSHGLLPADWKHSYCMRGNCLLRRDEGIRSFSRLALTDATV